MPPRFSVISTSPALRSQENSDWKMCRKAVQRGPQKMPGAPWQGTGCSTDHRAQGAPERRPAHWCAPSGFSTGISGATPAPVLQHPGAHCPVPQIPEERGSSPSPHSSLCPQLPVRVSTQRSTLTHTDEVYTQPNR